MRRRNYKLHSTFLNASMISAIDAPVEFEVSIGNYGNRLDDLLPPCVCTTQPTNAVFDGCYYYYLPWGNTKPCVVIDSHWEDISFRLEALNLLINISDTLVYQFIIIIILFKINYLLNNVWKERCFEIWCRTRNFLTSRSDACHFAPWLDPFRLVNCPWIKQQYAVNASVKFFEFEWSRIARRSTGVLISHQNFILFKTRIPSTWAIYERVFVRILIILFCSRKQTLRTFGLPYRATYPCKMWHSVWSNCWINLSMTAGSCILGIF